MKILTLVLIAYSAIMVLIHVSSGKLLQKWDRPGNSWAKRWFFPQVVLRVEALYWLLILASWPFWPSAAWKAGVVVFAVIHLVIWMAGELRAIRSVSLAMPPLKARRIIVAFDLVEAVALVAIAWFAAFRLIHAGRPFPGA